MGEGLESANCRTCRGPVPPRSAHCYCCATLVRQLGVPLVPLVAIAPYRVGDDLHRLLRGYKDAPVAEQRRAHAAALARLVRRWWSASGAPSAGRADRATGPTGTWPASVGTSIAPLAGWGAIATVPSSGRRPRAAVDTIVHMVPELARWPRYRLVAGPAATGYLVASPQGFELAGGGPRASRPPSARLRAGQLPDAPPRPAGPGGAHPTAALVVDDTWTTGARAQSAAAALRRAGVPVVGVLVIGRCLDPTASPWHAAYWRTTAPQRTWARAARLPARR